MLKMPARKVNSACKKQVRPFEIKIPEDSYKEQEAQPLGDEEVMKAAWLAKFPDGDKASLGKTRAN